MTAAKDLRPTTQSVVVFARLAVLLWAVLAAAGWMVATRQVNLLPVWLLVFGGQAFVTSLVRFGRWAARRPKLGRLAAAWMLGAGWEHPARRSEWIRPPMAPRRPPTQVIDVGHASYRKEPPR